MGVVDISAVGELRTGSEILNSRKNGIIIPPSFDSSTTLKCAHSVSFGQIINYWRNISNKSPSQI